MVCCIYRIRDYDDPAPKCSGYSLCGIFSPPAVLFIHSVNNEDHDPVAVALCGDPDPFFSVMELLQKTMFRDTVTWISVFDRSIKGKFFRRTF